MTLKEKREQAGYTQGEVSKLTSISIPQLSNYEAGNTTVTVEDCTALEKVFGRGIDWEEGLTPRQKKSIVQNIIHLSERYPIASVLSFSQRALREGIRINDAGSIIQHYAEMAGVEEVEPMLPEGVEKRCSECEDQ